MAQCNLSPRLMDIYNLTTNLASVDVGADHGYLGIYLMEHGFDQPFFATENKRGPYNRLVENIKLHGQSDRIKCVFADGLKFDYRKAKQLIISGMGGSLIASILVSSTYGLKNFDTLILEPQSDIDTLRMTLNKLGFVIEFEKYIKEHKKTYTVMKCIKGEKRSYTPCEYAFGFYPLTHRDEILHEYLLTNIDRIDKLLKNKGKHMSIETYDSLVSKKSMLKEGLKYYEIEKTN